MLSISTRKLTTLLTKASHGRFGESKAKEIRTVAADSFGVGFAKNAFSFQIRQLIEQLMFLENQIEELEEQISYLLHQTNEVITTIPGIGDILGAIILSEIGDIQRFDAPGKLVAFAGLDVKYRSPASSPEPNRRFPNAARPIFGGPFGLLPAGRHFAILFCPTTTNP